MAGVLSSVFNIPDVFFLKENEAEFSNAGAFDSCASSGNTMD